MAKTGTELAAELAKKIDFLPLEYFHKLMDKNWGFAPYGSSKLKQKYIEDVMYDYGVDKDLADILIDGAMSNPEYHRGYIPYKSYGIFEGTPMKKGTDGIKEAQQLLKENPGYFGAIYGFGTGKKGSFVLNKPFLVKDEKDIDKYQKALSGNSVYTKLKGIYPTASELK